MGFLENMLEREAYTQTKKALRSLSESATENQQQAKSKNETPEPTPRRRDMGSETESGTPASDLKSVLQAMDDYDFEHFVADLWGDMGWQTDVSSQSVDRGIDVTATRHSPYPEKLLIQAKRYGPNTTVGSPAVQQYASLKNQQAGVDAVIIVTTNRFSRNATEIGEQLNVKLVNGDDLVGMVERLDASDLVAKYAPSTPTRQQDGVPTRSSVAADLVDSQGGVATNPSSVPETNTSDPSGREGRWRWVAYATGVSLVGFIGAGSSNLFVLLVMIGWFTLPVTMVLDKRWTSRKWKAAYALGAVFFSVIVGGWYLYRRHRSIGFE